MHTDLPNHPQAVVQLHTGSFQFVRPSHGRVDALRPGHRERRTCPASSRSTRRHGRRRAELRQRRFLPAVYQGTRIGDRRRQRCSAQASQSANIANPHASRDDQQRQQLDLLQALNRDRARARHGQHASSKGVIESYELAFRMQTAVPKVMDFDGRAASHAANATASASRADRQLRPAVPAGPPLRRGGRALHRGTRHRRAGTSTRNLQASHDAIAAGDRPADRRACSPI